MKARTILLLIILHMSTVMILKSGGYSRQQSAPRPFMQEPRVSGPVMGVYATHTHLAVQERLRPLHLADCSTPDTGEHLRGGSLSFRQAHPRRPLLRRQLLSAVLLDCLQTAAVHRFHPLKLLAS